MDFVDVLAAALDDPEVDKYLGMVRAAARNRDSQRGLALYSDAMQSGRGYTSLSEPRGLIGSALQCIGILGPPEDRPLNDFERASQNLGLRAHKTQQFQDAASKLGLGEGLTQIGQEDPRLAQRLGGELGFDISTIPAAGSRRWKALHDEASTRRQFREGKKLTAAKIAELEAQADYYNRGGPRTPREPKENFRDKNLRAAMKTLEMRIQTLAKMADNTDERGDRSLDEVMTEIQSLEGQRQELAANLSDPYSAQLEMEKLGPILDPVFTRASKELGRGLQIIPNGALTGPQPSSQTFVPSLPMGVDAGGYPRR